MNASPQSQSPQSQSPQSQDIVFGKLHMMDSESDRSECSIMFCMNS